MIFIQALVTIKKFVVNDLNIFRKEYTLLMLNLGSEHIWYVFVSQTSTSLGLIALASPYHEDVCFKLL